MVSIGCSLNALRVRKWITVPYVHTLISDYNNRPYSDVLQNNADLSEVTRLIFCVLAAIVTVRNLAEMDTIISIRAGTMNVGSTLKFINAPTETKNMAANISFNGVANILVTEWTFDSAINTPAKNAPVATDIPIWFAINDKCYT